MCLSRSEAFIEGFDFLEPYFDKLCLAPIERLKILWEFWLVVRALDDTEDIYSGPLPEVIPSLEAAVVDRSGHLKKGYYNLLQEAREELELEKRIKQQ